MEVILTTGFDWRSKILRNDGGIGVFLLLEQEHLKKAKGQSRHSDFDEGARWDGYAGCADPTNVCIARTPAE